DVLDLRSCSCRCMALRIQAAARRYLAEYALGDGTSGPCRYCSRNDLSAPQISLSPACRRSEILVVCSRLFRRGGGPRAVDSWRQSRWRVADDDLDVFV